jgi:hypothetical protein
MSGLLTAASVMTCPHGGTVQVVPATTNVQIGGAPVLTAADTFAVAGCPFLIGIVPYPCVTVQWVRPATRVQLSGVFTLTATSVGLCLSAAQSPQGPVMIVAAQPNVTGQ